VGSIPITRSKPLADDAAYTIRTRIRVKFFSRLIACLAIVSFCCGHAAHAVSPEPFAKLPEFTGARVSPKGDRVAVTMRSPGGRVILNVLQLPELKSIGTFGMHNEQDIEDVYWSSNDRLLFGLSYREGKDEAAVVTGYLMAVNVDGTQVRTLLGPDKSNVLIIDRNFRDWDIVDLLDNDDQNVVVAVYEHASWPLMELYRINTLTGQKQHLLQSRYRFPDFMTDHAGKLRFQGGTERDGTYVLMYRDSEAAAWKEVSRYSISDEQSGGLSPLAFTHDDKGIYFEDSRGEGPSRLAIVDVEKGGEPQALFGDLVYDLGSLLPSRTRGVPIGVVYEGERTQWRYFDPPHPDVKLFEAIRQAFGNRNVWVEDFSRDRSKAVVFAGSDVDAGAYYVFDLDRRAVLTRFPTRSWIDAAQMSPVQPITLKARDGLELHGYLTLPKGRAPGARKKMVVLVHGGPIARDTWDFDAEVQWLAANGYAVLQVNFRGSSGYGNKFIDWVYGEWGAKMQDDVTDATRWAIEQGHADPAAVCIYGGSYGAYSAMMGLVREPDLYRCGVGYVGIYDLEFWQRDSLAASTDEGRVYQRAVVGKDAEQLRKISPAWRAAEIRSPVLLVHSGSDSRAPVTQFERMKDALTKAGKPVQTLFKRNEDHGFISEANRAEFLVKLVEFMDASLAPSH
jgi:dipeptidyl aminopeptidase/acylaminoacyl peptidase